MENKTKNEGKFEVNPGDIKFTPSQCYNCINNVSVTGCKEFQLKPDEYAFNDKECPAYEEE